MATAAEAVGAPSRWRVGTWLAGVEAFNMELFKLLDVRFEAQVGQDSGVHRRVQRLHPAVQ